MMDRLQKARKPAVLGIAPDGSRWEVVHVRRTNGSAEASTPVVIDIGGDPLADDVITLGKRLREGLDAAGIRERRCAVALPADWIFARSTPLPDLAPEDLEDFLELEVEGGFPYGPDQLSIVRSNWNDSDGHPHASLMAVPRESITRLQQILAAARLQPVSFAPALTELHDLLGGPAEPRVDVLAAAGHVGILVAHGNGMVAYRALMEAVEADGDVLRPVPGVLFRELRVTLGQLPANVRAALRSLRILGSGQLTDTLADTLAPRCTAMGLAAERIDRIPPERPASPKLAPGLPVGPALATAIRHVSGRPTDFQFLPPRVSALQQFAARYSSTRLVHAGFAAGGVVGLVLIAFVIQQVRLSLLRSEWNSIAAKVREVEDLQTRVKKFRPWFDDTLHSLLVLRTLTEAFPEDATVTAKNIEILNPGVITCSGTASDSTALLRTLDKLRAAPEVSEVQVDQLRGKSPLQFTFNFRWETGGKRP
jgi:hypothetical protein